ncbi:ATP-binding protein [Tropicimonas isoalkanivorans]|uniref:histidine kinase n=1 Tax=Tropicimonas isoalkanivorans TaxID=441112 RepID=A0A1I1D5E7_9RHOB|nr:ATP-binding protein [Tropicimonas isoalkanivorans]SFB70135.1 two-component system, OmpR family, osmolarity sensor histidine kinase EnvZ [Tropicimonas isoalkanivorans]
MKLDWLKRPMPRGLYGRAALILVVPVTVLMVVVSLVFIQRHFEGVTQQLTSGIVLELREVVEVIEAAPDLGAGLAEAEPLVTTLGIQLAPADKPQTGDRRVFYDVSGRMVIDTLRDGLPEVRAVDLRQSSRRVIVQLDTRHGPLEATVDRRRASASNPHQFLVLMASIGVLMTGIAYLYLRNQLRPITRLAEAAEAFGKGRVVRYRPSGALEVRAAGRAFLDMRARIERQIEQRTLMLSGVSHDLRTPITRLKLALSMMPEGQDVEDMQRDVAEMEGLIDSFLDFARSDQEEDPAPVVPVDLARKVVERAARGRGEVSLSAGDEAGQEVLLREQAVERALGNLVGNALRYGERAAVSVACTGRTVVFSVEDDGPGIPEGDRERAVQPFTRLDAARNQDRGSGVGLGLSLARDIARRHGGALRLSDSETLGGLKAELVIPR